MANRLAGESSPYLLQHAENPVDWYPWGEDALKKSSDEDKPIFLSVGYSACHWCHVMEHESFEDEGIAKFLNDNFVSIKVDREERPDIDQIYMNAVMALRGGGGGWPLSVFLTPDRNVFFGGTYWPPKSRPGIPGFDHVLNNVLDAFTSRREQVESQSAQITEWLNDSDDATGDGHDNELEETMLTTAALVLENNFDYQHGGFGSAPKFPHAMDIALLLNVAGRWPPDGAPGEDGIMKMVDLNLTKMARGGIYDHLGGGFARYSVDEEWLVPHFEKMLYDNSLLADVYLQVAAITGSDYYKEVAAETLDYILNYLTDEQGAFYSTEDADSEGVEGKFYVWSEKEIRDKIDPEIADHFCAIYGVTSSGNFEGENILNLQQSVETFAADNDLNEEQFVTAMNAARRKLLGIRNMRIRPALDNKVLVSWNGLAIAAMARGAIVLGDQRYAKAAAKAADFILGHLRREDGRLLHTWRHGKAKLDAYLDDYSYMIVALVQLYQADFDSQWIDEAVTLTEQMIEHFSANSDTELVSASEENDLKRGFYFTADDHELLIARTLSFQDSSVPSGNSMAATGLLSLGRLAGRQEWVDLAGETIRGAVTLFQRSPLASGQMLCALERFLDEARELVLVCETKSQLEDALTLLRKYPVRGALGVAFSMDAPVVSPHLASVVEGKSAIGGEPTLFVCSGSACQAPAVGEEKIKLELARLQSDVRAIGT